MLAGAVRLAPDGAEIATACYFAYALAQTAGLMCMASSTVDINLHLRRRWALAAFVAVVIVLYSGLQALQGGTDEVELVSD